MPENILIKFSHLSYKKTEPFIDPHKLILHSQMVLLKGKLVAF